MIFFRDRRLELLLKIAIDSGNLLAATVSRVEQLIKRLPDLCSPETKPSLLPGNAQQNNFVSTAEGPFVIDPAVYYGHPEADLDLIDAFESNDRGAQPLRVTLSWPDHFQQNIRLIAQSWSLRSNLPIKKLWVSFLRKSAYWPGHLALFVENVELLCIFSHSYDNSVTMAGRFVLYETKKTNDGIGSGLTWN